MNFTTMFRKAQADKLHKQYVQSTKALLEQWYSLTRSQLDDQHARIREHEPMKQLIQARLDADPQLKAKVLAGLALNAEGYMDSVELEQIRNDIMASWAANDVVVDNEYFALVGKLELAYQIDLRKIEASPDTPLSDFVPYYEIDAIKSYLKI